MFNHFHELIKSGLSIVTELDHLNPFDPQLGGDIFLHKNEVEKNSLVKGNRVTFSVQAWRMQHLGE